MKLSTVETLRRMLMGAYLSVHQHKEQINEINIFPVPDQDTGDNIDHTLQGLYEAIATSQFSTIADLRTAALDGALTNAAGNIGIITTSFLKGMLASLSDAHIHPTELIEAFRQGSQSAYESIQEPKAGTVLDVISVTSAKLQHVQAENLDQLLTMAHAIAVEALNSTQQNMELYRRAAVVDAGGYGFVLMIEGMAESLRKRNWVPTQFKEDHISKPKHFVQLISQRYEVVSLIQAVKRTKTEIVKTLQPLGNCLDIVEANSKIKIHIHTDVPDEVVSIISKFGDVIQMKTADMTNQDQSVSSRQPIGLVVDDGSSIAIDYAFTHDIAIVPFTISWEKVDQQPAYKNHSIYQKMMIFNNQTETYGWPKSSQPSPKSYFLAFREQLTKYDHVVCIPFASTISGAFNSARQARQMLDVDEKVRVSILDLNIASPGQDILVRRAVQLINTGYTLHQLQQQLSDYARSITIFGIPENVKWITQGGRVSGFKASILKMLQRISIRPIIQLTKKGMSPVYFSINKPHVAQSTLHYLHSHFPASTTLQYDLVIHHADDENLVTYLHNHLNPDHYTVLASAPLSPALGVHSGPKSIICAIARKT